MLLVAVATFFFISRAAEYQIVVNEIERTRGQIRSIGYFSSTRPESGISEAVEFIQALDSPYIAFEDFNRRGFATLNGLHNILSDGSIRPHELLIHDRYMFFYGELLEISGDFDHPAPRITLTFQVDSVMVGYPEWITPDIELEVFWQVRDFKIEDPGHQFEVGKRYFLRAEYGIRAFGRHRNLLRPLQTVDEEPILVLPVLPGEEIDFSSSGLSYLLADIEVIDVNHRAMRVLTSKDLTAKPQVQEQVSLWHLRDGRWINHLDYLEENPVAVVHWLFAAERNLSIGDTISLTLWDFNVRPPASRMHEPFSWGIRTNQRGKRDMQESTTWEVEVEIVGTFVYQRSGPLGLHSKDIWVPTSLVPEWFGANSHPTNLTYSFVLTSYLYQSAFYESYGDELMGFGGSGLFYQFRFLEHGGERISELLNPILQNLRRNTALFTGAFLFMVLLIVYLFLRQRSRDVAILRALGCPTWKIVGQLLSTVFLLWLPMVFFGGLVARNFARQAASDTLSPLAEYDMFGRPGLLLDGFWLFRIGVFSFIALVTVTFLGIILMIRKNVLTMLQGETTKSGKKGRQTNEKVRDILEKLAVSSHPLPREDILFSPLLVADLPKTVANRHRAIRRNLSRHIRRTPIKSIFILTFAFLSIFFLGWLRNAIIYNDSEIERLWNTTVIDGELFAPAQNHTNVHDTMIHTILPSAKINIQNTGFVDAIYLEVGYELAYLILPLPDGSFPSDVWSDWEYDDLFDRRRNRFFMVSDLEKMVQDSLEYRDVFGRRNSFDIYVGGAPPYNNMRVVQEPLEITFAQGFGSNDFDYGKIYDFEDVIPVILPDTLMENLGLELGDSIFISHPFDRRIEGHPFLIPHPQDWGQHIWSMIHPWTITGEIAGIYTGVIHRPFAHDAIILPYGIVSSIRGALPGRHSGEVFGYSTLKFTVDVAHNRETEALRDRLHYIVNHTQAGVEPLGFILRDEELILIVSQLERNLALLRLLFPVILAVSLFIATGLSLLLLHQNAKSAAVMRILGLSKGKTGRALVTAQLIITLIGVVLGLVGLLFIGYENYMNRATLLIAGFYLLAVTAGSLIGAILISNHPPLELLQVKE